MYKILSGEHRDQAKSALIEPPPPSPIHCIGDISRARFVPTPPFSEHFGGRIRPGQFDRRSPTGGGLTAQVERAR